MSSKVAPCPKTEKEFATLSELTDRELLAAGLRPWGPISYESPDVLWLCPSEWWPHIPDGAQVVNVLGHTMRYDAEKADRATRGEMFSFGILKPKEAE